MQLGQPHRVEPVALGGIDLIERLLEGIRLALSGHHRKLVEHAEFHRRSSLYAPSAVVMRGYFFASL